jgi:hypothetical protein
MPLKVNEQKPVEPEKDILNIKQAVKVAKTYAVKDEEVAIILRIESVPVEYRAKRCALWFELEKKATTSKLLWFIENSEIEETFPAFEEVVKKVVAEPVEEEKKKEMVGQPQGQPNSNEPLKKSWLKSWLKDLSEGLFGTDKY